MIIDRLTVSDFRAYKGNHDICLSPRTRYKHRRPIILFGGLNGAGKTTLLLALKLALYGRLALGVGTTKASYSKFVRSCIHSMPKALVQRNSAFVELEFCHGKLGRQSRYVVRRSWYDDSREIRETVTLSENGIYKTTLSDQAMQGFLNELVPLGVSELFFFDGEKIAELAEDDSGSALGEAIHRLLGLDLVERLRNDLRVYMLRRENKTNGANDYKEIASFQNEYENLISQIAIERAELEESKSRLREFSIDKDRLETIMTERGGEWGMSREAQKNRVKELTEVLRRDERELRDILSGAYPLSLATTAISECMDHVANELANLDNRETNRILTAFAESLKSSFTDSDHATIDNILNRSLKSENHSKVSYELSPRAFGRIDKTIESEIPESQSRAYLIQQRIEETKSTLDQISLQISQSPDEATLAAHFKELSSLNEKCAEASAEVEVKRRELKAMYGNAIGIARALRDKHKEYTEKNEYNQPLEYANSTRELLREFGQKSTESKLSQLESEFADAFQRLVRKDDMVAGAVIDCHRFTVKLLDRDGTEIERSKLSAGEKQIYAIAMLEALARTSGRLLPIVIDTPLGRLDSHHRENLVREYFPRISHQVILLSTDTEVDETFYRELSPHISHAFKICYDDLERSAHLEKGYFWRTRAGEKHDSTSNSSI